MYQKIKSMKYEPKQTGKHVVYNVLTDTANVVKIEEDKLGFYWVDLYRKERPTENEMYFFVEKNK